MVEKSLKINFIGTGLVFKCLELISFFTLWKLLQFIDEVSGWLFKIDNPIIIIKV